MEVSKTPLLTRTVALKGIDGCILPSLGMPANAYSLWEAPHEDLVLL
jgi:hypothetical protein